MCQREVEAHCNVCEDCAREIEEKERLEEDRHQWERHEMEDHFSRYPHG